MDTKHLKYLAIIIVVTILSATTIYLANIKNVRVNIEFSTYTPE